MALTKGTNCGFVSTAPTADPAGANITMGTGNNITRVTKDTAPTGALKVTEIGFWVDVATVSGNFEVGIYDNNGGTSRANNLLTGSSKTNSLGTGAGWRSVTGLNIPITAGSIYWIGVQIDPDSSTVINGATTGTDGRDFDDVTSTLPSTFSSEGFSANLLAFYAVYQVATGTKFQINIGDAWKAVSAMQVNVNDTWKAVASAKINVGDVWKTIF